jgi:hypothetical protein
MVCPCALFEFRLRYQTFSAQPFRGLNAHPIENRTEKEFQNPKGHFQETETLPIVVALKAYLPSICYIFSLAVFRPDSVMNVCPIS